MAAFFSERPALSPGRSSSGPSPAARRQHVDPHGVVETPVGALHGLLRTARPSGPTSLEAVARIVHRGIAAA
jgi:hypothetical protein